MMSSPYATSWLLTGTKGPDYVDRGVEVSSDDWGTGLSLIIILNYLSLHGEHRIQE